jgi:P-type Ca2+ transporter type 2C
MAEHYHAKSCEDVLRFLDTTTKGLSETQAENRLVKFGYNEIVEEEKISPLKILISQFKSFIIGILLIAVIISLVIGEKFDALVIGVILVLNAVLGFIQEYKAEEAIEALRKMASLKAVVLRNGEEKKIDAKEIVPGDIIVLETGEKVPADARLIEAINLYTQEAALTGESNAEVKQTEKIDADKGVADMNNMVFAGTIITRGRGLAAVTATGMGTEIGKIARMMQQTKDELTPLQKKLKQLGEYLGAATLIICLIVFGAGVFSGKPAAEMFIAALSLAVAAIPEGLPAVVTISLALGIQRMIKRNALIRKLPSVETLGSTTVICTDKTGTLTHNQMTVRKIFANDKVIDITGSGYSIEGNFSEDGKEVSAKEIEMMLKVGALCNDAKLADNDIIGDPTEGALIVSAAKAGLHKSELERQSPRIAEIQFDSERKSMSTYHNIKGENIVCTKGAPDVIIGLCNRIMINGNVYMMTKEQRKRILDMNEQFAKQALRVLGFAYRPSGKLEEKELIFLGLQAMIDPPRDEAKESIKKCKEAGIKVVMITGDYKLTAEAIGKELGIEGRAIDARELDAITDLEHAVDGIGIYARVDPKHKIRIVEALQKKGYVVAMTGDGVNDAPALKKADIGVAMGITGTDVAKEASDMILTDDNFTSIVGAVEEGRGVYDNIRKFVEYLLSSNLGEILTIFAAIILVGLFQNALPLLAIQILWINLLTDGLPALALGVEPKEKDIMQRKPRKKNERILSRYIIFRMIAVGVIMMLGTLALFKLYLPKGVIYAQTVAFTVLMMFQMFNVLNCRSENSSLFKLGVFGNMKLIIAILISVAMQLAVIYTPLNVMFKTIPLTGMDWIYIVLVSSAVFVFVEIMKMIRTRKANV